MGILKLAAGVAVGYVLGSRAGREKYESIAASARKFGEHPRVVEAQEKAKALIGTGTDRVNAKLHATAESTRPSTTPAPTPTPSPRVDNEVTKPLTPATTAPRTRSTTPTTEFGTATNPPL